MAAHRLDADHGADLAPAGRRSIAGEGASSNTFWWRRCKRAVALAEVADVAEAVGDHLNLDVARRLEVAFHVDGAVAEGGSGLRIWAVSTASASATSASSLATFMPRPPPPEAALISTGKADGSRAAAMASSTVATPPSEPGTTGMPAAFTVCLALILSPMMRIWSGFGPMKVMPWALHDLGEAGVLAQEPVAGVDGLGAGDLGGRDDRRHVQIALRRRRRADADALVCHAEPTWRCASGSECTATVAMPISLQARWMRSAISPRLAMRILSNTRRPRLSRSRRGARHIRPAGRR